MSYNEKVNVLEEIIAYKKTEVEQLSSVFPIEVIKKKALSKTIRKRSFHLSISEKSKKKEIALIAEVKKASPSKGIIREDFNHIEIAKSYENGGAICISVLTDSKYFMGDKKYLSEIKNNVSVPLLRKDFIIDPYQVYESIDLEADCILLIVSALDKNLFSDLLELSNENNLDVLIEIHDEREMEIALEVVGKVKANPLIGINNRNLKTFEVSLDIAKNLVRKYKKDLLNKCVVSESGIYSNLDIKLLTQYDVYAFLVGESLMREDDVVKATKTLICG